MQCDEGNYLPVYWFEPNLSSWEDLQMRASSHFLLFSKMLAPTSYLLSLDDGDTICEIAGGEARTTRVPIRYNDKRTTAVPNFDHVDDLSPTNPQGQQVCLEVPDTTTTEGMRHVTNVPIVRRTFQDEQGIAS